jgi:hypothetical protein
MNSPQAQPQAEQPDTLVKQYLAELAKARQKHDKVADKQQLLEELNARQAIESYCEHFSEVSMEGVSAPLEFAPNAQESPDDPAYQDLPHQQPDPALIKALSSVPHGHLLTEELMGLWLKQAEQYTKLWTTLFEAWTQEPSD